MPCPPQEQNITLERPYYDIVRIKAEQSDEEEEEEEESSYDYLSPFLPALVGMQRLTRDQVRGAGSTDQCLLEESQHPASRLSHPLGQCGHGHRGRAGRHWSACSASLATR